MRYNILWFVTPKVQSSFLFRWMNVYQNLLFFILACLSRLVTLTKFYILLLRLVRLLTLPFHDWPLLQEKKNDASVIGLPFLNRYFGIKYELFVTNNRFLYFWSLRRVLPSSELGPKIFFIVIFAIDNINSWIEYRAGPGAWYISGLFLIPTLRYIARHTLLTVKFLIVFAPIFFVT